jgi:hypothetical protein
MGSDQQSMRQHVRESYGLVVRDEDILTDTPDDFSYRNRDGSITGWTRNTETFWRNRDLGDEDDHIEDVTDAYLAKPLPKQVTIKDHGPWNPVTSTCLSCGRDLLELYKDIRMPECKRDT